jgi:hypothetical protein
MPGSELSLSSDPSKAAHVDQLIDELESKFLWNGVSKDALALAKELSSDRSSNPLVASLASSFLKNYAK